MVKGLAGVENGFVFDAGDDQAGFDASPLEGDDGALEGEVEAFGGAGGEDHLAGVGVYQVGDLLGGGFNGGFGAIADGVIEAAGVAKVCGHGP